MLTFPVLIVSFQCTYLVCSVNVLNEENHNPVFCKWFYFSQTNLAWWISAVIEYNQSPLGERISPHTKEDLEKKMFQLLAVYTSVTSVVQLVCFFET